MKAILCLALALAGPAALAQDDVDAEARRKCTQLAAEMFGQARPAEPRDPSGIEVLVTWRASCAERPPTGPGHVVALCEADVISSPSTRRRVFFWKKQQGTAVSTGYHWCD